MTADQGSLRGDLKISTETAWRLYCALLAYLPHKETAKGERVARQRLSASTIPWNSTAAGLTQDLHAKVRQFEVNLKASVSGIQGVRRGSSEKNTRFALEAIVNLVESVDDQQVRGVLGFFRRWNHRAEAVFDPDHGLRRVPREPGSEELRCPWCSYQTMRWQPATGILVCVNPECRTDREIRPRWLAAYELVDDELRFTWEPIQGEAI